MGNERQALVYFRSSVDDPWRWDEQGRVITWHDGTTVAFREEITGILHAFTTEGLPPFRSVVMALAACRGKFPPSSEHGPAIQDLVAPTQDSSRQGGSPRPWNDPANQDFSDLLARLRLLQAVPQDLRQTVEQKAVLLQSIFDSVKVGRTQPAREIVGTLEALPPSMLNSTEAGVTAAAHYRLLHAGLRGFKDARLALRQRTGLESLPNKADLDLKPAERARQLLESLTADPEFHGLARIARDVMAAIYLPRSLSEQDDLAIGGLADISNRGTLDRLLPSELANDDLTLAMRLALNEALYIRREPPSKQPPLQVALLLDSGLRLWGLPRVFAAAVALAFIAREGRCSRALVFRAQRNRVDACDLLSREGLVRHLSVLETYTHPGTALAPFYEQIRREAETEVVVVTHPDAASDPGFLRALSGLTWRRFYIATVDREGAFTLYAHPQRSKPMCTAKIDLQKLFSDSNQAPLARRESSHLPLIFEVKPFPFLLPAVGRLEAHIRMADGSVIGVFRNGRVMRWHSKHKGAETLIDALPPGKTAWCGAVQPGTKVVILRIPDKERQPSLVIWDQQNSRATYLAPDFGGRFPLRCVGCRDLLLLEFPDRVFAGFLLPLGQPVGELVLPPGITHQSGRYFSSKDRKWYFPVHHGTGLRLESVTLDSTWQTLGAIGLIDLPDREDTPLVLTVSGDLYLDKRTRLASLGSPAGSFKLSCDGRRLLVHCLDRRSYVVDLATGVKAGMTPSRAEQALDPAPNFPVRNVRVRFDRIAVSPAQGLLIGSQGKWFRIGLNLFGHAITLSQADTPSSWINFEPTELPGRHTFSVRVARWKDGSTAWLDSRGVLHLQPALASAPEFSIVLHVGQLAVWCSDGSTCGYEFFLRSPTTSPETMMQKIEQFRPAL